MVTTIKSICCHGTEGSLFCSIFSCNQSSYIRCLCFDPPISSSFNYIYSMWMGFWLIFSQINGLKLWIIIKGIIIFNEWIRRGITFFVKEPCGLHLITKILSSTSIKTSWPACTVAFFKERWIEAGLDFRFPWPKLATDQISILIIGPWNRPSVYTQKCSFSTPQYYI